MTTHTEKTLSSTDILNSQNVYIAGGLTADVTAGINGAQESIICASDSITRPANTSAYSVGDIVAGATVSLSGTVTINTSVISALSEADIAKCKLGMKVAGTGIPSDSFITIIGTDSVTFGNAANTAATATNTGVTVTGTPVVLTFDYSANATLRNGADVEVEEVEVSDNSLGCANGNTQFNLVLFKEIPFLTSASDNAAMQLPESELAKRATGFGVIVNSQSYGLTSLVKQVDISRKTTLQSTSKKLYGILQAISYTPTVNSNKLTVTTKGVRFN